MKKLYLAGAALALCSTPAFAQDADYRDGDRVVEARDGLRVEARVAYESISDPDDAAQIDYELGSGAAFGAEIGYDIAVSDTVVVGPFVGYDFSTIEECDGNFCVSSDGYFTAGLHVGFAVGSNSQVYAKAAYSQLTVAAEGTLNDPVLGQITVDDSETGGGYEFAFGYEQGFGRNAYGRVEVGIGEASDIYGFDFQRSHIGVALGARF